VEAAGIEPASEERLARTSTSVVTVRFVATLEYRHKLRGGQSD